MSEFPVEPPRTFAEFSACEALQRAADPGVAAPVPAWLLWELVRVGARLQVCFHGTGVAREPLGFVLALPRGRGLRVVAYGVRRDLPGRAGVLGALAGRLLEEGTEVIWPFDPLEPQWAEFLLEDLGAEARAYEIRRDRGGKPEHFKALAAISKGRVEKGWKGAALRSFFPVNSTQLAPGGVRVPRGWNRHLTAPRLILEVPGRGRSALPREAAARWAEAWAVLEGYMDRGYALVGFYRRGDRAFLVLERGA